MEENYAKDMHSQAHASLGRICLSSSLIEAHKGKDEEILAIICHELGHSKLNHLLKNLIYDTGYMLIYGFLLQWALSEPEFERPYGSKYDSQVLNFGIFTFAFISSIDTFLRIGLNANSRKHEYEADKFAADHGYRD